MQNNPFGFLSSLNAAGGAMQPNQDNSGQMNTTPTFNNAGLMSAMQSMLTRAPTPMPVSIAGGLLGSLPGAVPRLTQPPQLWPNKPAASNDAPPDLSVFRQFQLPPNVQSSPQPSSSVGSASSQMQGVTASPGMVVTPGNWWNNPTVASPPGAAAVSSTPAAGAMANFPVQSMNNPFMNMMMMGMQPQQMGMQAQQANPMMQMMQGMMQMMQMSGMMGGAGPQAPNVDPNAAKQMVVQLVSGLQQSGQLTDNDTIQKLLQQVGGSTPQAPEVISILPDNEDEQVKHENEEKSTPLPVAGPKKAGRGKKGKAVAVESSTDLLPETPQVVSSNTPVQPRGAGGKGRKSNKPAELDSVELTEAVIGKKIKTEDGRNEGDRQSPRISPSKSVSSVNAEVADFGKKPVAARNKNSKANKLPPIPVTVRDSDDESMASDLLSQESGTEGSSFTEEMATRKLKAGEKKTAQEKKTKGPSAVGSKTSQKAKKVAEVVPDVPVRRIKVEDNEDEEQFGIDRSFEAGVGVHVKSEQADDVKPFRIPPGVQLKRCEVRLAKLKRDANGKFVIPSDSVKAIRGDRVLLPCKTEPARSPVKSESAVGRKRGSSGPAKEDPMYDIQLLPIMNGVVRPEMRTLFLGNLNGKMQWLSLIGWAASRAFCQCAFCPILSDTPKAILNHIKGEHPDLTFALTKLKPPMGKYLYLFCRHCDFVSVDVTITWLHFEVYHNVSDILEGTARPRIDDFAPAKLEMQRGPQDIIETQHSYMCYDCELISENSKQLAIHVLHNHVNTVHYNGCFVKLLGIRKPLKSENVQYKRIISDDEFAEFRQEAFICMMCDYIAHCPYQALSHNLITHQTKRVLFECMETGCKYNCINENVMMQHLTNKHKLKSFFYSSTTLLEPSRDSFVECAIGVNRKASKEPALQKCSAPANANANAPANAPAATSPVTFSEDESSQDNNDAASAKKIKSESGKAAGDASSGSWSKDGKAKKNGEQEPMELDDNLPDDIKITINPPSPDENNEGPDSPASDNTIVGDSPDLENDASNMEDEEDEKPVSSTKVESSADGTDEPDVPDSREAGNRDFITDIPLEPCCLSTDIYLPVPNADICTFDSEANAGGFPHADASSDGTGMPKLEPERRLETPKKLFP